MSTTIASPLKTWEQVYAHPPWARQDLSPSSSLIPPSLHPCEGWATIIPLYSCKLRLGELNVLTGVNVLTEMEGWDLDGSSWIQNLFLILNATLPIMRKICNQ